MPIPHPASRPTTAYAVAIKATPCKLIKAALLKKILSEDQTPEQKEWLYDLILKTGEIALDEALAKRKDG